jgi:hypothetical protein
MDENRVTSIPAAADIEVGQRVELIFTNDPYSGLQPGDRGDVRYVDSTGTVFVRWDGQDPSPYGLVPGEDAWRKISWAEPLQHDEAHTG